MAITEQQADAYFEGDQIGCPNCESVDVVRVFWDIDPTNPGGRLEKYICNTCELTWTLVLMVTYEPTTLRIDGEQEFDIPHSVT